ncbi:scabin-related ADP-ribosyltransferase [Aeromonas salmonicida]|uniref:scabin-related ADP-ribosyltransferase n=1 Tax=Aeromonas salmonicida TaxID=645 RepID=UPI003D1D4CDD
METSHFYLPFFILLATSTYTFANPPRFVYRVDSRSYDEIFNSGFHAWGRNYNIVAHVNGATCSAQNGSTSGFISTAADFESARAIAIADEHLRQGRNAFLYTIRADHTFYSGPASIDYLQQYNPLSPLSIMSLEMARRANEWDAIDEIPSENIREVIEYSAQGGQNTYTNARYRNENTTGNPEPYTDHLEEVLQFYNFPIRLPNGLMVRLSSCFASCLGASSSSRTKNDNAECIDEPEKVVDFTALITSSIL